MHTKRGSQSANALIAILEDWFEKKTTLQVILLQLALSNAGCAVDRKLS